MAKPRPARVCAGQLAGRTRLSGSSSARFNSSPGCSTPSIIWRHAVGGPRTSPARCRPCRTAVKYGPGMRSRYSSDSRSNTTAESTAILQLQEAVRLNPRWPLRRPGSASRSRPSVELDARSRIARCRANRPVRDGRAEQSRLAYRRRSRRRGRRGFPGACQQIRSRSGGCSRNGLCSGKPGGGGRRFFATWSSSTPATPKAFYNLGLGSSSATSLPGRIELAPRDFARSFAPEAPFTLGVVLWQTGRPEEAAQQFREAIARKRIIRRPLHARHRPETAACDRPSRRAVPRGHQYRPSSAEAHLSLGRLSRNRDRGRRPRRRSRKRNG